MRDRNGKVLDWAIMAANGRYREDIALLCIYGSFLNGTAHSMSDVDFYFVPKNEKGCGLARTFIIEGVGYDLFPMSWKRLEGLSELKEPIVPLLGDSKVVFSGTEDDLRHFEALRKKLSMNLKDAAFTHQRALEEAGRSVAAFRRMKGAEAISRMRAEAAFLIMSAANAVAYENGDYFHGGLKTQMAELRGFERLPEGFMEGYCGVVEASCTEELTLCAKDSLVGLLRFLGCPEDFGIIDGQSTESPAPRERRADQMDYAALASFYEEASSTFNKVYHYCGGASQNATLAFLSAACLQRAIDEDAADLSLDVMAGYDPSDLPAFASRVKAIEDMLVEQVSRGAKIAKFANIEEFLIQN